MTFPNATWLGNPDIGYGGWGTFKPKWIIVHATAGDRTIENVATTFVSNKRADNPSSTHFAVGIDGRVGQFVPEDQAAWGNGPITGPAGTGGDGVHHDAWWDGVPFGNPNSVTFSIEHCKPDSANASSLTDAQKRASFALIAYLCDKYNIPKRWADANGGLTGHFSMDPVDRSRCPGNYPWDELFAYLNQEGGNTMLDLDPNFFVADGDGWRAKGTGKLIRGDILNLYRSEDGIKRLRMPRTEEVPLPNCVHGETAQLFEAGVVIFDPQRKFDNPPGSTGTCYYGQFEWYLSLLDPSFAPAPKPAIDTSGVKHALAALDAEVAKLP